MTLDIPGWALPALLVAIPCAALVLIRIGRVLELRRQTNGDPSRWLT